MKKREITEKLSRRGAEEGDRSFDKDFWAKAGSEAIFSAAWEMVDEVNLIRGRNASESRLQRNIQNLQRRRG